MHFSKKTCILNLSKYSTLLCIYTHNQNPLSYWIKDKNCLSGHIFIDIKYIIKELANSVSVILLHFTLKLLLVVVERTDKVEREIQ